MNEPIKKNTWLIVKASFALIGAICVPSKRIKANESGLFNLTAEGIPECSYGLIAHGPLGVVGSRRRPFERIKSSVNPTILHPVTQILSILLVSTLAIVNKALANQTVVDTIAYHQSCTQKALELNDALQNQELKRNTLIYCSCMADAFRTGKNPLSKLLACKDYTNQKISSLNAKDKIGTSIKTNHFAPTLIASLQLAGTYNQCTKAFPKNHKLSPGFCDCYTEYIEKTIVDLPSSNFGKQLTADQIRAIGKECGTFKP